MQGMEVSHIAQEGQTNDSGNSSESHGKDSRLRTPKPSLVFNTSASNGRGQERRKQRNRSVYAESLDFVSSVCVCVCVCVCGGGDG